MRWLRVNRRVPDASGRVGSAPNVYSAKQSVSNNLKPKRRDTNAVERDVFIDLSR
jgi:hypothetical protein